MYESLQKRVFKKKLSTTVQHRAPKVKFQVSADYLKRLGAIFY